MRTSWPFAIAYNVWLGSSSLAPSRIQFLLSRSSIGGKGGCTHYICTCRMCVMVGEVGPGQSYVCIQSIQRVVVHVVYFVAHTHVVHVYIYIWRWLQSMPTMCVADIGRRTWSPGGLQVSWRSTHCNVVVVVVRPSSLFAESNVCACE